MDMKTEDRRAAPRINVQFRTTFSASSTLEGTGIMLDLSRGGCRIESPVTVEPGTSLELRIYAPDIEWPLMIDAASVQWVSGQTFGLAFSRMTDTEHQRLGQVVSDLLEG
jgi:PilZ domain-containing protein